MGVLVFGCCARQVQVVCVQASLLAKEKFSCYTASCHYKVRGPERHPYQRPYMAAGSRQSAAGRQLHVWEENVEALAWLSVTASEGDISSAGHTLLA